MGANSENSYVIPFAYKWKPWPWEKFKAFDSDASPDLDDKLKKFIKVGLFKSLFGAEYDSLVLIDSKEDLKAVNLRD